MATTEQTYLVAWRHNAMAKGSRPTSFISALLLAACSANPPAPAPQQPGTPVAAAPAPQPQRPRAAPLTLDAYKKSVAERIAQSSPDIFTEPLPEMFKSIVVLEPSGYVTRCKRRLPELGTPEVNATLCRKVVVCVGPPIAPV